MRKSVRGLTSIGLLVLSSVLSAQTTVPAVPIGGVPVPPKFDDSAATHKQVREIAVRSNNMTLQTLCMDGEGRIVGLVAPPRGFTSPMKNATSELHIIAADGKTVATWKVDFHGHSVNVGPDGTVFVAGDGKVAKFDKTGKQIQKIELPHIAELLKGTGELRAQAEKQIKQQKDSFANVVKQLTERKDKIAAKKEEDRTPVEKKQLEQYERTLKSYEASQKYYDGLTVDSILSQTTGRLRIINGIALSAKDLFIVCGESKGYGYAVWRMDHEFKNAKQVLTGVVGCCGQMDVQTSGNDFLLAENTKHRFARYDRDGKALGAWGERGKESEGKSFGGCCNPMNLRCCKNDVYTAESEGVVKRFNDKGEFVALVGKATLAGGCKNVAVAASNDGKHVFFCDLPGSRVIVLEKK